jgi:hypothetical protein
MRDPLRYSPSSEPETPPVQPGYCASGDADIGELEIGAFEQQRFVTRFRQRIGDAIAEIELGGMSAFPILPKGNPGDLGQIAREGTPPLSCQRFVTGSGGRRRGTGEDWTIDVLVIA